MSQKEKEKKPLYKKWWFWLIVVFVLWVVGHGLSESSAVPDGSTPSEITSVDESKNFLIDSELKVCDVLNGSGTEVIGQRAYINISSEQLQKITSDFLVEFAHTRVENSGYNWFSIIADNGNGIIFSGCIIDFAEYGKMDDEGMLEETIGHLSLSNDSYTYSEA